MFKNDTEAVNALIPFVVDSTNSLWDSGLLFIEKQEDGTCRVELTGFYYESAEDKQYCNPAEKERPVAFAAIHKTVYDYLQDYYRKINPNVSWNRLIVEVHEDGNCTAHYEFDGEEVSPDAPPEPEVVTAAYLCQNLKNCLAHHAPNNYEWVWQILEKEKRGDGNTVISGTFFYSLNADKSNPQTLEPGEYIYMYTVSERLFDEFLQEATKNWSKIRLDFSKDGKAKYYLLKQDG